jgi:type IV secretion system protein VirB10
LQAASAKISPDKLKLRAAPRRVVRFRRGVIVAGAAVSSLALAGVAWMALGPKALHIIAADEGRVVSDRRTQADAVANLPSDYSRVTPTTPILGPPLPGDLGKPILDRQRAMSAGGDQMAAASPPPAMSPAQQAAETERQRIAAEAKQAREAGVLVQSSGRTAVIPASFTDNVAPTVQPTASASKAAGLALDPDKDQNAQQRKLDFIGQQTSGGVYNAHTLQTPASPWQVMAGSVIAASLLTGLNSDLPGMVVAQVTEPVFDTVTGRTLLIPQGARLIGSYDSVVAFGQRRALLVWQRIILPDGDSIQIDNLPATDSAGYAGLADQVDFHTWQLLRASRSRPCLGLVPKSRSGPTKATSCVRSGNRRSSPPMRRVSGSFRRTSISSPPSPSAPVGRCV